MSVRIETAGKKLMAVNNETNQETFRVVNFDAERFRAPFTLRCAALLLDYTILIAAPVVMLVMARASGLSGAKLFDNSGYYVGWLIALLLLITDFVILPVAVGCTIGKAVMGLRIVQKTGRNLTFQSAMIRHLIGYPLTLLTGGIGFLVAIFNREGRALHDYISSTIVVQANRKNQRIKS